MINIQSDDLPDPQHVLRAAEEEPVQRLLDDYTDAIHTLRDKNFTFREIAEWLTKFGFSVDHNAVYRAYAKTVPDYEAAEEANRDDELERDEALRDAELNGGLSIAPVAIPAAETPVKPIDKEKTAKANAKNAKSKRK